MKQRERRNIGRSETKRGRGRDDEVMLLCRYKNVRQYANYHYLTTTPTADNDLRQRR